MFVLILKSLSQILVLAVGVTSVIQAHLVKKQNSNKKSLTLVGWLTLAMILIGFLVFVATDFNERREAAKKDTAQQNTIVELERVNKTLLSLRADRDLAGIEISFKPSTEHWARIAKLDNKIKSPATLPTGEEFPYSSATLSAERTPEGWKIDFGKVSRKEGTIKFASVLPGQKKSKEFEEVINEALIGLWIKWGDGSETEVEPKERKYPSAITISEDLITLTLLPPLIKLNMNSLISNTTIILRTRDDGNTLPRSLRFRSLDSSIVLDQTIDVDWKEKQVQILDDGDDLIQRTKPYISGPYRLQVALKSV